MTEEYIESMEVLLPDWVILRGVNEFCVINKETNYGVTLNNPHKGTKTTPIEISLIIERDHGALLKKLDGEDLMSWRLHRKRRKCGGLNKG